MLYPSPTSTPPTPDPNAYLPFKALDAAVIANLAAHLDDTPSDQPSALVAALTKALCCLSLFPITFPLLTTPQTSIDWAVAMILGSSSSPRHRTFRPPTSPS